MSGPVRLIGQAGTDEINVGTTRYTRHEDGSFLVPPEVASLVCDGKSELVRAPLDYTPPVGTATVEEVEALIRGLPPCREKTALLAALLSVGLKVT